MATNGEFILGGIVLVVLGSCWLVSAATWNHSSRIDLPLNIGSKTRPRVGDHIDLCKPAEPGDGFIAKRMDVFHNGDEGKWAVRHDISSLQH